MPIKRLLYALDQSVFYRLKTRKKLAKILKISTEELRALAKGHSLYREFDIPKKNGGSRHVENPCRPLKLVQARIARLLARVRPADYLFCPVKGRSYISNAAQHQGKRVVRCLDVRKYFPSTQARRVFWFFKAIMRCEPDVAAILSRLATYQEHLPTGSPLSPIMAYFAHFDVWEEVARIARAHGYTLTVYYG